MYPYHNDEIDWGELILALLKAIVLLGLLVGLLLVMWKTIVWLFALFGIDIPWWAVVGIILLTGRLNFTSKNNV